ncbi:uncharacterized protein ARMOST_05605 [Armillaria ostoyae]|uniref:Uncharacterized protein n=1 Tax=Armillaria ostoyae TaxID=47428 RepID=A0A284R0Q0_ARMOS|nr:uncharacterized protein ARMOST_05605 [Armillaria ostoyae]
MSRPSNTTSLRTTSEDYKIATDREITAAEAKAEAADHQDAVDDKHNQGSTMAPTLLVPTLAYCHNGIDYLLLTSKFSSSSSTSVPEPAFFVAVSTLQLPLAHHDPTSFGNMGHKHKDNDLDPPRPSSLATRPRKDSDLMSSTCFKISKMVRKKRSIATSLATVMPHTPSLVVSQQPSILPNRRKVT